MSNIYIMRVNWHNYNAAWHEGKAFTKLSLAHRAAVKELEECFNAEKFEAGEMIFKELNSLDRVDMGAYLRRDGEADIKLGYAEIYRVPLAESGTDDSAG